MPSPRPTSSRIAVARAQASDSLVRSLKSGLCTSGQNITKFRLAVVGL